MDTEEMINYKTYEIKELCKNVVTDLETIDYSDLISLLTEYNPEEVTEDSFLNLKFKVDEDYLKNMLQLRLKLEEFDYILNCLIKIKGLELIGKYRAEETEKMLENNEKETELIK